MNVNVKCFATLSKEQVCDYHGATPYELSEGATVNELVGKLKIKPEEVKIIFVNHKEVELNHVLSEGDQVALSPKTGGM
jgi:molybdopterin converting factor small subunit